MRAFALVTFLGVSASAAPAADPKDLRACADPALQAGLEQAIGRLGLGSAVADLESRPDTRLYRKSDTWRQFHSDSTLVEGQRRRYILVGIAEDPRGGEWLERMAVPLDDLVHSGSAGAA